MLHTVISKVFEGGVGCTNGGRSEKSNDRAGLRRPREEALDVRDNGGVLGAELILWFA